MSMDAGNTAAAPCTGQPLSDVQTPASESPFPRKDDFGWRRIVRNFTPSWFSINMGTGVVSIVLRQLPYTATAVHYVSYVVFGLNVVLFCLFTAITVARYVLYPGTWPAMIAHPTEPLFLGCFPIGFATIIDMMAICCKSWGHGFIYLTWSFWWVDVVLSVAVCISMSFIVMAHHKPDLQTMTAALLLPIVPTIVAAGSGSILSDVLPNDYHAWTTIVTSYVLWGIGESFTACVVAVYFMRLSLYHLAPGDVIVSAFLPIAPLGQGGFGIQKLGKMALARLPKTKAFVSLGVGATRPGEVLYVLGVFLALLMWGFGLIWLAFAIISVATTRNIPYNLGWWGAIFPLGVLALCSGLLGVDLDSDFFRVSAMILSASVVLVWVIISLGTVYMLVTKGVFHAPCLKDMTEKEEARGPGREPR